MNRSAMFWRLRAPSKRMIVHYLQPHAPYITSSESPGYPFPTPSENTLSLEWNQSSKLERVMRRIEYVANSVGFDILGLELRRLMGLPPSGPIDAARRKFGLAGLRKAYAHNLAAVLQQVSALLHFLPRPVIITADHGEFLGDGGRFGHPCGSSSSILRNVPWFEADPPE